MERVLTEMPEGDQFSSKSKPEKVSCSVCGEFISKSDMEIGNWEFIYENGQRTGAVKHLGDDGCL